MKTSIPEKRTGPRRKIIAVIGDASCQSDSKAELLARKLGELLIDAGYRIVTGGMGGVMEAVCSGAKLSKNYREGDTIGLLPGHSPESANPFVDIVIPTGLDFGRNYIVAHADAVVAIGGGAGTLSEICYAWMHKRLIVALGKEGWAGKLAGKKLDWRIRYQDIKDDRIFAAKNPQDAAKILDDWLPLYKASYAARESIKRTK